MSHAVGRTWASEEVLARIPQQHPFRFIDDILRVDGDAITGRYAFRSDLSPYEDHFPGIPVTPGAIGVGWRDE